MKSQTKSTTITEKYSNPIFRARKAMGISQEELAVLLGLTKNYVWMLECGRKTITPKVRSRTEELVDKYKSTKNEDPVSKLLRKAEIDSALNESPSDKETRSSSVLMETTPGIMRMADQFERMVIGRLDAIDRELKHLRDAIDSKPGMKE